MKYVMTILLFMFIAIGCKDSSKPKNHISEQEKEYLTYEEELYRKYFTGDINVARDSLNESIKHSLQADGTNGMKLAQEYYSTARLFVLEYKSGNKEESELLWVKTRYLYLKHLENTKNINRNNIYNAINEYSKDKCIEFFDKYDIANNKGDLPFYARNLRTQ